MITLSLGLAIATSKHESWTMFSKIGAILIIMCMDASYIVPILL